MKTKSAKRRFIDNTNKDWWLSHRTWNNQLCKPNIHNIHNGADRGKKDSRPGLVNYTRENLHSLTSTRLERRMRTIVNALSAGIWRVGIRARLWFTAAVRGDCPNNSPRNAETPRLEFAHAENWYRRARDFNVRIIVPLMFRNCSQSTLILPRIIFIETFGLSSVLCDIMRMHQTQRNWPACTMRATMLESASFRLVFFSTA